MERLFSAKSICYLVGGYDGSGNQGDISPLLGVLDILGQFANIMLGVPLVAYGCKESFDDLYQPHPDLFRHASLLYFDWNDNVVESEQITRVPNPPSVYSQILLCGRGPISKCWAETNLDIIHNLQRWITFDGKVEEERFPPLIISGQQVSPELLTDPDNNGLVDLFKRAALVGVRDHASYESIRALGDPDINSKLFLSADDSLDYMITSGHLIKNCFEEVDRRDESIGRELLKSMERLSVLQSDYNHLLNASSDMRSNLSRKIQDLRSQLQHYEQLRFQLVDRLFTALGKRRFLHPLIRFFYGLVRRIARP